jgi:hypothetical protein
MCFVSRHLKLLAKVVYETVNFKYETRLDITGYYLQLSTNSKEQSLSSEADSRSDD